MNDIIKLNVGGQLFATTRATLCAEAGSMLAAKFDPASNFAPANELDGGVFLDRSPKTFEHVLSYLRHGCQGMSNIPDELLNELRADADYFGLEALKGTCDAQLLREYISKNVKYSSNAAYFVAIWMKKGWRIEKEYLEHDEKTGNATGYNFLLSRPKQS
jgi:hypothetical protein